MLKGKSLSFQINLPPIVNRTNRHSRADIQNFLELNIAPPLLIELDMTIIRLMIKGSSDASRLCLCRFGPTNPQEPITERYCSMVIMMIDASN